MPAASLSTPSVRAGLDIGGTKLHAVLIDETSTVRAERVTATPEHGVPEHGTALVASLLADHGVVPDALVGVGVGTPGIVDVATGIVTGAVNVAYGADGAPLGDVFRARFPHAVVAVENDVNAATIGAHTLLHSGVAEFALLSLGTGVAAGVVSGGRLLRGATGAAGEVGHVPLDPDALPCGCGQRGCVETVASGAALARAWGAAEPSGVAAAVYRAAAAGDTRATAVRERHVRGVAAALRLLVLTVDPSIVVLGGGVADLGGALLDAVRERLDADAATSPLLRDLAIGDRVRMLPPRTPVGAIGAALATVGRPDRAR